MTAAKPARAPRRLRVLVAVIIGLVLVGASALITWRGYGPLAEPLCGEHRAFVREPVPAPRLLGAANLGPGEKRVIGGSHGPYESVPVPTVDGDPSAVSFSTVTVWTHRRCARIIDGYSYWVLRVERPVRLELISEQPARVRATAR